MRIGLVTTSYPQFPGDPAGGFVAEHAAFLAGRGHDVEVIAAGRRDPGIADQADLAAVGSIRVHRVAAPPGIFDAGGAPEALARSRRAWLSGARFSLALTAAVARRARGWDAAIAHWLVPSGLAALLAAPGRPLLAIAHSGDVHLLRRLRALGPMAALSSRPTVRVSFVSEELRRLFAARAPRCAAELQVCPMGIDLARLRAASAVTARGGSPATVLFLGRLVPVKGVDVLIRAAGRWRCGARLVIAGAGPAEPSLRGLAKGAAPGRVHFAGQLLAGARDRALASADLVVLPSVRVEGGRSEGLPVAALEAMAAGAALVVSSVGGLAEIPAATRVPPGDPTTLARAVDTLVLDAELRRRQVEAQDRAIASYDWAEVGPRLLPPLV